MKAGVILAKTHGEQLVDLPEEKVKSIRVPMLGVAGTNDLEMEAVQRMDGVVEGFEFEKCQGVGHDQLACSAMWKEAVLLFLAKHRSSGGTESPAQLEESPAQLEMRGA